MGDEGAESPRNQRTMGRFDAFSSEIRFGDELPDGFKGVPLRMGDPEGVWRRVCSAAGRDLAERHIDASSGFDCDS